MLVYFPVTTAFFTGGYKSRMDITPGGGIQRRFPYRLSFRADETIGTESFQLQTITTVQKFIVVPRFDSTM
jgi:hypothetical protein